MTIEKLHKAAELITLLDTYEQNLKSIKNYLESDKPPGNTVFKIAITDAGWTVTMPRRGDFFEYMQSVLNAECKTLRAEFENL